MQTVTISLPSSMTDWIETQVREGRYTSIDDYFRNLVGRDLAHDLTPDFSDPDAPQYTLEDLRQIVKEARQSGTSSTSVQEIFEEAEAIVRSQGLLRE